MWYAPTTKPTCNDEIEQLRRRAVREPGELLQYEGVSLLQTAYHSQSLCRCGGWDTLWNLMQDPTRALPPPMLSCKENTYTVEDLSYHMHSYAV